MYPRFHYRNLFALSWEEKAALAPSFEGQLVQQWAAMINRRRHFMATLMDQPLTKETLSAAKAANIFMG